MIKQYIILFVVTTLLCGCYNNQVNEHDALTRNDSVTTADSTSFYSTHHYGLGYNFIVHKDTLPLISQQPEEYVSMLVTDTFDIVVNTHLAVSDIRIIPKDSIDSVWVQLISEDGRIGWIHETDMLQRVVPTDPISQFIMFFSDTHLMIALIIVVLIGTAYIARTIKKRNAPIVHLRDIPSFYPTLLCIIVACSATFYASLQMFGADIWRHFYYHPSLNPFNMPPILGAFISSVWAMLVIGIAAVEDTRHYLTTGDCMLYLCGLCGLCASLYIIFSVSTLYYIGYPLLVIYCWFAVTKHISNFNSHLTCGNCGKSLKSKGRCPYCKTLNI